VVEEADLVAGVVQEGEGEGEGEEGAVGEGFKARFSQGIEVTASVLPGFHNAEKAISPGIESRALATQQVLGRHCVFSGQAKYDLTERAMLYSHLVFTSSLCMNH